MSKFFLLYDRHDVPMAVVRVDHSPYPETDEVIMETLNQIGVDDFTSEKYLSLGEEVTLVEEADFHEFATEYVAKLGEDYYDSHYQSAAQLQGESSL